ncbi:acyltransferase [Geotalea uraniireducens]|uniref:Transferase hexapeptide repeat containing protein n=1 Tax=Geotalea uraniireducens (strain Rf4) TaxID=351605 RepID=A5G6D0_GEOUR|nr:acyltransferase [Geotalea uraniireducens]ABQ27348.1 transferase hexapeptide repeat containing protein [Geotalea uraniireducens Rf4]
MFKYNAYDYLNKLSNLYVTIKTSLFYKLFVKHMGRRCLINKPILFSGLKNWSLGSRVIIFKNCRIEVLGAYGSQTFSPEFIVGDYTQIHQNAHITCAKNITIGKNVVITSNVTITDINHLYDDIEIPINLQKIEVRPVSIGDQTYIYNNSVILPGVSIGKHCIVAANTVVAQNIPDYCLVAGTPAKLIRRYNHNSNEWEKVS